MSNAFAIAAVTAVMRALINARLADAKAGGIVNTNATVIAQPPDRISLGDSSRVNLFLYEISPNTGWSNEQLPSRDSAGQSISNPALALDLNYLLSVYGIEDMEAEVLLGHAMQVFHETPGLSRAAIRKFLDPAPPDAAGILPKAFRERAVTLADQIESIRITPRYLKPEEMSKIWSSLQAHYRPSVVYQATVVLIQRQKTVRTAFPVLTRGPGDRGATAQANLLPPFATLLAHRLPGRQTAVSPTGKVELFGHHLSDGVMTARLTNTKLDLQLTAAGAALTVSRPNLSEEELAENETLRFADTQVEVDLAQATPAGQRAAGYWSIHLELLRPGETVPRRTNALPLAIAPSFATTGADQPVVTVAADNTVTVELTVSPQLRPRQSASLVLGDRELPGPQLTAATSKPRFKGKLPANMIASGTSHLARLRFDGVESIYIKRNPKPLPPEFDLAQRITMP